MARAAVVRHRASDDTPPAVRGRYRRCNSRVSGPECREAHAAADPYRRTAPEDVRFAHWAALKGRLPGRARWDEGPLALDARPVRSRNCADTPPLSAA